MLTFNSALQNKKKIKTDFSLPRKGLIPNIPANLVYADYKFY